MKQIYFLNKIKVIVCIGILTFVISSCDYREIADVGYADQKIYMPAASVADLGIGGGGLYHINAVASPDRIFRYVINNTTNKFNVPLGVYRSGANLGGTVDVSVSTQTDTIGKLITSGKLTNTTVLPANQFTIESSVTVADGSNLAPFTLSVDLPFLLANNETKYAIAVKVASTTVVSNEKYNTTIVVIDPVFLTPIAQFTSIVDDKSVSFSNTSTNGVSYSWNFGDGSLAVTTSSPTHVYAAAGTYNVTLTTVGALGKVNQATVMNTVIVP